MWNGEFRKPILANQGFAENETCPFHVQNQAYIFGDPVIKNDEVLDPAPAHGVHLTCIVYIHDKRRRSSSACAFKFSVLIGLCCFGVLRIACICCCIPGKRLAWPCHHPDTTSGSGRPWLLWLRDRGQHSRAEPEESKKGRHGSLRLRLIELTPLALLTFSFRPQGSSFGHSRKTTQCHRYSHSVAILCFAYRSLPKY
jgi:hypothetical protein